MSPPLLGHPLLVFSTDQLGPEDIREYIAHLCSQLVSAHLNSNWMTGQRELGAAEFNLTRKARS
ncbi:MAG: hypothetical protein JWN34_3680 [Bryobacterales bacterium]|nr:hypothetical protein [Bryobacterales bacterium]